MNQFDSLVIKFPTEIGKIKEDRFDNVCSVVPNLNNTEYKSTIFKRTETPWLKITANLKTTKIEFSSKVLGDDYPELISLNTIEKTAESLQKFIDVKLEDLLKHATVSSCDVTQNLLVKHLLPQYIYALSCVTHPDFQVTRYRLKSVVFTTLGATLKERVTWYNKSADLRKVQNAEFLKSVNSNRMFERFRGVLRVERNLSKSILVHRALAVPPPRYLKDVLSSRKKPILSLFRRITSNSCPPFQPSSTPPQRFSEELKTRGKQALAQDYNFNPTAIFAHVDSRTSKQMARHYKSDFQEIIEREKDKKEAVKKCVYLAELEELIRQGYKQNSERLT